MFQPYFIFGLTICRVISQTKKKFDLLSFKCLNLHEVDILLLQQNHLRELTSLFSRELPIHYNKLFNNKLHETFSAAMNGLHDECGRVLFTASITDNNYRRWDSSSCPRVCSRLVAAPDRTPSSSSSPSEQNLTNFQSFRY